LNPRLAAIASAILFSTGGAAIKSTSLTSWQISGLRSFVAALAVLILLPETRRQWTWRSAVVSVAYALCLTSFVLATKNTTAANAIFLQATAPVYLVLLGPWLLGEKVRSSDWTTLAIVALGMVLVFWDPGEAQALAPNPLLGNWLGALSGLTWALTVCGLRWLSKSQTGSSMTPVLMGNCIGILICLPQMFPLTEIKNNDIWSLAYLGVFQVGLAYWCLTRAMANLGALEASLLIMVEPALNPIWTWWLHGERPTLTAIAGGALIIGSALLKSWQDRKSVVD
jgi:drug/metabolite transporter (DMT)-like permease